MSSLAFSLAMQQIYQSAIAGTTVQALAIQDDFYLCGESAAVMKCLGQFQQSVGDVGLSLSWDKCKVLPCLQTAHQPSVLQNLRELCANQTLKLVEQLPLLGAVLSTSESEERQWCTDLVDEMEDYFRLITDPAMPPQIGYALLRQCTQPRLSYLTRVTPSGIIREAAELFDKAVLEAFTVLHQLPYATLATEQKQILQTLVNLPCSRGGMGIASAANASPAAYLASLLSAAADISSLAILPTTVADQDPTAAAHAASHVNSARAILIHTTQSACEAVEELGAKVMEQCGVPDAAALVDQAGRPKLQHRLMEAVLDHTLSQLNCRLIYSPHHRATLLSAAQKDAYRWLLASPADDRQFMVPAYWCLAVRHRLFMPPADNLPARQCGCGKRTSVTDHPAHFHTCNMVKGTAMKDRHDMVARVLGSWAQEHGAAVRYEPSMQYCANPLRADLLISLLNKVYVVDVKVVEPSGEWHVTALNTHNNPLAAARRAATDKRKKYIQLTANHYGPNAMFVPVVLETAGGVSSELRELATAIAIMSPEPAAAVTNLMDRVSVTLQLGNSKVDAEGLSRMSGGYRDSLEDIFYPSSAASGDAALRYVQGLAQLDWTRSTYVQPPIPRRRTMVRLLREVQAAAAVVPEQQPLASR